MLFVLIVILLIVALGGLPMAPLGQYHSWGYAPSGLVLVVVIICVVLLLTGRL